MTATELRDVAYQTPFRPYRVRLRSGEQIEIRRSLRAAIADDRVVFGTNDHPDSGIAQRMRIISIRDIAAAEPL